MFNFPEELHEDEKQITRQKSALKLNVISVDKEAQTGVINNYDVTLEKCRCRDFHLNKYPCKHMYRLAHELGFFVLQGKVENDPLHKGYTQTKKDRKALKEIIGKLDTATKKLLQKILFELNNPPVFIKNTLQNKKAIDNLTSLDLIQTTLITLEDVFIKYNIVDIVESITETPKKYGKKTTAITTMKESYPEQTKIFLEQMNTQIIKPIINPIYEQDRLSLIRFLNQIHTPVEDIFWE